MNKEDIIRMAREAGGLPDPMVFIGAYERFAALVAAAEREACAKVAEGCRYEPHISLTSMPPQNGTAVGIANRIRARGETK